MDSRLIPVNAFVALTSRSTAAFPNALGAAGYQLEGLEVPVRTEDGVVVVDAVAFHPGLNRLLVVEAKSGKNIEVNQAKKYGKIEPDHLVRDAGITVVNERPPLTVVPCYICMDDTSDGIAFGLSEAGCDYPMIVVADDHVELRDPEHVLPDLSSSFPAPSNAPPPTIVAVDDQSPDVEFDRIIPPTLVARATRADPGTVIPVSEIASDSIPHLHIYGTARRSLLVKKVEAATRRACEASPQNFEFKARTGTRSYPVVKVLDPPERSDPRGRTQRYQGMASRFGGRTSDDTTTFEQGELFDDVDLNTELAKLGQTGEVEAGEIEAGEEDETP